MAAKVIVPKLGMSNEPIMLIEWKAKEGDKVEKGSVVLVVETEKIRNDVEAEASGYLHILMEAGKEAPIGSVAGVIAESKEELASLGGAPSAGPAKAAAPAPAAKTASSDDIIASAGKIIVPKLGMSNEPIMLIEWKAKEGDKVDKGSVVLVVETEKIRNDVEAETSGYLHIIKEAGKEAPIGSVAGVIVASQANLAALQGGAAPAAAPAAKTAAPAAAAPASEAELLRISPVARKLAEEHMIDISKVTGSGPEGRITREDIEREIAQKAAPAAAAAPAAEAGKKVKQTLPLTGIRKAIAEHMVRSLATAAQLTVMGELDVAELVKFREKLVAKESDLGVRITYTDLMIGLVAKLLKDYPLMNASVVGNEIKVWDDINVSVAVALKDGLIVPVVRNADKKSLVEISKEVKSLAKKARERTLAPAELQGGTFTITNLGAMGGGYRFETVIINQPEAAILGTGEITDRPVVRQKQIVIRPIMTYYLTYDHRVMNGTVAAAFANSLAKLENPEANLKVK